MNQEPNANELFPDDLTADPSASGELLHAGSLLTAYALNELAVGDRALVESRLRASPDDGHTIDQAARLGKLLRQLAANLPLAQRSPELREAVLAALANSSQAKPTVQLPDRLPRRRFWLPLSLAASLLVVSGTLFSLMRMKHAARAVAQREKARVLYSPPGADAAGRADISAVGDLAESDATYEFVPPTGKEIEARLPALLVETGAGPAGDRHVQLPIAGRGSPPKSVLLGKYGGRPVPTQPPIHNAAVGNGAFGKPPVAEVEALAEAKSNLATRRKELQSAVKTTSEDAARRRSVREAEARLIDEKVRVGFAAAELANAKAREASGAVSVPNTESYPSLVENPFRKSTEHPLSTFSIDVDTASYTNARRFLNSHALPPPDAVRIEELLNYFQYDYPQPDGETPFSVTTDVADCPWNTEHRLLRVGLKGREVPADQRPAGNLVFLLDVSGSMDAPNKLPLVKEAMYLLTDKLTENDRVSIIVYAGNSGLVLPPTNGTNKAAIRQAISQLAAGGSTNGGQGLQMAYDTAQSQFVKGGTNRVILATDGDFNVGVVDQNDLVRLIEERAKSGVFLSTLGFGIGNLKDGTLEKLADKGNGNYAYIDTLAEARRVLVEQLSGTLVTLAKDVKLQIEFNPAQAAEYRLIGYEDRVMPHQDFHDDRKDAGEIGAGHTVTALYEIVPAQGAAGSGGEPLKYQRSEPHAPAADSGELATLKLRYKDPDGAQSRLLEHVIGDRRPRQATAGRDMNFAAAVAAFGMLLRGSPYRGDATYAKVLALAEEGLTSDPNGYRSEFAQLVRQAREISGNE